MSSATQRWVSSVLTVVFLASHSAPVFALRQTGLEESNEKEKLRLALLGDSRASAPASAPSPLSVFTAPPQRPAQAEAPPLAPAQPVAELPLPRASAGLEEFPAVEVIHPERLIGFRPKAFLFDFDDTLWTGFPRDFEALEWARWVTGRRDPAAEIVEEIKQFLIRTAGLSGQERFDQWNEEGRPILPRDEDEFRWRLQTQVRSYIGDNHLTAPQYLMPGAKELLEWLKSLGLPLAVITGGATETRRQYAGDLGIGEFFEGRIYGEGEKVATVAQAAKEMGVSPAEAVVIGDGGPDLRAARANGALAVGFATSPEQRQRLIASGADVILYGNFTHLQEILVGLHVGVFYEAPGDPDVVSPDFHDVDELAGLEEQVLETVRYHLEIDMDVAKREAYFNLDGRHRYFGTFENEFCEVVRMQGGAEVFDLASFGDQELARFLTQFWEAPPTLMAHHAPTMTQNIRMEQLTPGRYAVINPQVEVTLEYTPSDVLVTINGEKAYRIPRSDAENVTRLSDNAAPDQAVAGSVLLAAMAGLIFDNRIRPSLSRDPREIFASLPSQLRSSAGPSTGLGAGGSTPLTTGLEEQPDYSALPYSTLLEMTRELNPASFTLLVSLTEGPVIGIDGVEEGKRIDQVLQDQMREFVGPKRLLYTYDVTLLDNPEVDWPQHLPAPVGRVHFRIVTRADSVTGEPAAPQSVPEVLERLNELDAFLTVPPEMMIGSPRAILVDASDHVEVARLAQALSIMLARDEGGLPEVDFRLVIAAGRVDQVVEELRAINPAAAEDFLRPRVVSYQDGDDENLERAKWDARSRLASRFGFPSGEDLQKSGALRVVHELESILARGLLAFFNEGGLRFVSSEAFTRLSAILEAA